MLKSSVTQHVIRTSVIAPVEVVLGLLTAAALLGPAAIRASVITIVLLANAGLMVLLIGDRRDMRRRTERDQQLLGHYCRVLRDRSEYSWRIISWIETVTIKPNGDTRDSLKVKAIVESVYLDFFRLCLGAAWNQGPGYRKKVRVHARSLEVDGIGGTRYETTFSWMSDGRMEFVTHFKSALKLGEKIELTVESDWPGKCIPLMRYREPEEFRMHFRSEVDYAHYVVVLPSGEDAYYEPIGFTSGQNGYTITSGCNNSGQREIAFAAFGVRSQHVVGMRLDLK